MGRPFYMDFTEHCFRLATRRNYNEINGDSIKEWHRKTTHWLDNDCTVEEKALITDFYSNNQSIYCGAPIEKIKQIRHLATRCATAIGLRYAD